MENQEDRIRYSERGAVCRLVTKFLMKDQHEYDWECKCLYCESVRDMIKFVSTGIDLLDAERHAPPPKYQRDDDPKCRWETPNPEGADCVPFCWISKGYCTKCMGIDCEEYKPFPPKIECQNCGWVGFDYSLVCPTSASEPGCPSCGGTDFVDVEDSEIDSDKERRDQINERGN